MVVHTSLGHHTPTVQFVILQRIIPPTALVDFVRNSVVTLTPYSKQVMLFADLIYLSLVEG
ncbi:hypothetical protein Anas_00984 [Armadillidium nasatum]|uniref:Uncharacterized protein n=1 Tax=Armadillidium nasatum TaxID=96803 RepID=A0A5N5SV18_9CRUS|nr:hypothetical protein Anas_00984 [Armadillidium nasatum]